MNVVQIGAMQQAIYNRSVTLLIILLTLPVLGAAQTVSEKLQQQTNYRPHTTEPDEQLIEVARRFKIPMAIEWLDEKPVTDQLAGLKFDKGSVLDLIKAIVDRAPQENLIVEDRIVRVFPPSAFNKRLNFLNLRLRGYCVKDECVYGADFEVRIGIDALLYPEKFKYGFNGGFGGGEPSKTSSTYLPRATGEVRFASDVIVNTPPLPRSPNRFGSVKVTRRNRLPSTFGIP